MKCSEFNKHMQDHVDGRLDDILASAMDEHAKSCTCCRQELNCEIRAVEALSSVQTDHTPPYVLREVLDRVQSDNTGNIWLRWSAIGVTTLMAAVLLTANMLQISKDSPVLKVDRTVVVKNLPKENDKVTGPTEKAHVKTAGNTIKINTVPIISPDKKRISATNEEKHATSVKTLQKTKRVPSANYFVVMTPVIDPDVPVYPEYSTTDENQVDSSYSIQVEDRDAATLTNLSVTNEVTPEMQPKNTVEFSITNTAPPVGNMEPERSFNYEDNDSINCLDTADGIG